MAENSSVITLQGNLLPNQSDPPLGGIYSLEYQTLRNVPPLVLCPKVLWGGICLLQILVKEVATRLSLCAVDFPRYKV